MGSKLLQLLEDVGYNGPLLDSKKLEQAIKGGPKSIEYTALVAWFAEQLTAFNEIDETVHPTTTPDEASSFLLELSFFLKELGCVSKKLMTGHVNQRLSNEFERTFLIEYLANELMASKILEIKCPTVKASMEVTINESNTAKNLREMMMALQIQKPPEDVTPKGLFGRLENKVKEILRRVPNELVGKSFFIGELSMNQWQKLSDLQLDMHKEYSLRRDMLLKRLDVTIQSFLWSERVKAQEDQLNEKYHAKRDKIFRDPNVTLADLLAARDDLAIIEKTSNASVRRNTRSRINNIIIGAVPDRGGRPYEQEPPPPEMPPWQKDRVPQPQSFRGGRGGGGRGGNNAGGGGRGGGGGGGGGYRDNKSATNNFGQNLDYQQSNRGYDNRGGYQSDNRSGGYNRGGGGGGGGGYQYDNRGGGGGYQGDTRTSGGYQSDHRSGGGYQMDNRNSGDIYQRRDDNQGRSGRVQGGWNQSNNSSNYGSSNYQRGGGGGYNRGGRY